MNGLGRRSRHCTGACCWQQRVVYQPSTSKARCISPDQKAQIQESLHPDANEFTRFAQVPKCLQQERLWHRSNYSGRAWDRTMPGVRPIWPPARRLQQKKEVAESQDKYLTKQGLIVPSISAWSSQVILIRKKDGISVSEWTSDNWMKTPSKTPTPAQNRQKPWNPGK